MRYLANGCCWRQQAWSEPESVLLWIEAVSPRCVNTWDRQWQFEQAHGNQSEICVGLQMFAPGTIKTKLSAQWKYNEYVRNSELYTCQFWHFPAFPLNTQDKTLPKRLQYIIFWNISISCGDSHAGQYHFGTFGQNFKAFNLSVSYLWWPCLVPLSVCSLGTFATWRLSNAWGGQDLVKSLKSCRHFMKIRRNFSPESCLFFLLQSLWQFRTEGFRQ